MLINLLVDQIQGIPQPGYILENNNRNAQYLLMFIVVNGAEAVHKWKDIALADWWA